MSLRLIELICPMAGCEEVDDLLKDQKVLGVWTSELHDDEGIVRVLVPIAGTEAVTDILRRRFGKEVPFRIILFSVEATVPSPESAVHAEEKDDGPRLPNRISREELYQDLSEGAKLNWAYMATVILSTVVAAVGLIRDEVAIVIAAMVIAPLLGSNVALVLAATLGDGDLARRALKTIAAGAVTALALSIVTGFLLAVDPSVPSILSRTSVGYPDIILALAAGSAGSLAYTTGLPAPLIGVMVAVALLPPLVVTGLLAGAGYLALAGGALLLVAANVTCLNLAGMATFLAQRVGPRTWWEAKRAKKARRLAAIWWLSMLAGLVAVIFLQG